VELKDFYFAHDGMFLIPLEHLSPEGMSEQLRAALLERGESSNWLDTFDKSYARYWERATTLYERAPETWFPPRKQNLCIITDRSTTRPYYQPFNRNSWTLYHDDFDLESSSVELAAFLMLQVERFYLSRSIVVAVAHSLSYFLSLDDEALSDFRAGAERATRPDADAYRALAAALPWIGRLFHDKLRPLQREPGEEYGQLADAELSVPKSVQGSMQELVGKFSETAQAVVTRYFSGFAADRAQGAEVELQAWLSKDRPRIMITGVGGAILWDPDEPADTSLLAPLLSDVSTRVAASIRADLEVCAARYDAFINSLKAPEALPNPGDDIEQAGLTYIHAGRKLIAYNILEPPGHNRLREVSAPYERLMIGARTIHELGHLAVDADLVGIADADKEAHAQAHAELAELFERIIESAPLALTPVLNREIKLLAAKAQLRESQPGLALAAIPLRRMPDYLANVLARDYLPPAEMETYVRQQVNTLAQEDVGPFAQMARYAYEFQYLSLSGIDDPRAYFFDCTWFDQHFVARRITTREHMNELFDAVGKLCATYSVDRSGFK
jgi:hypothetical protein